MKIRRIVPNIISNKFDESKRFYLDFLGMELVMDMEWILTFSSTTNPLAQLSLVKTENPTPLENTITITIEVGDVDEFYQKAILSTYEITYPITDEPWGVRRFSVMDPNGVVINIMSHKNESGNT